MEHQSAIKQVGVIGVGRMGRSMALNLHRAGFAVRAYDVSAAALHAAAQAGLEVADSLVATVSDADAVILMLPDDDALRDVMSGDGGLLGHLRAGQIAIDMSTNMLATSQRLATLVADRGASFLDAPVSGGQQGARAGSLSIMVGGDAGAFKRSQRMLSAMGSTVTYIGSNGMGLIAKYVNQMLMEATFCAVAEAFALAASANVDLEAIYHAVKNGLGASRVLERMFPQLLSGELGSGGELGHHYKDGGYAVAAGQELGAWTPVTQLTHELFKQAVTAGQVSDGAGAIARIYEERAGIRLIGIGTTSADRDSDA